MEKIIEAVPKELIRSELTQEKFLRKTRKGDNEIYVVNIENAPHVLREIGRLREVTFRASGGGTPSRCTEGDFPESSDLAKHMGCIFNVDHVDLVVSLARFSQKFFLSKL